MEQWAGAGVSSVGVGWGHWKALIVAAGSGRAGSWHCVGTKGRERSLGKKGRVCDPASSLSSRH